jgi:hypothetical protein
MANGRPRSSGVFSGLVLITIGTLFLLHYYTGFGIGRVLGHWWPLILIFWGLVKLYERMAALRQGRPGGWITPGEVFLVIGMIALVGVVVAYEHVREVIPGGIEIGQPFTSDIDVTPKTIPANAKITILAGRGDLTVRSSDVPEIRVSGKKSTRAWNEKDAERMAGSVSVEIVQQGDGWQVQPSGFDLTDSRYNVDMDVVVPKKSQITVRNDKGDITVADMGTDVSVTGRDGDIEISDTAGSVNVDARRGDIKVTDTKGDVTIANRSGRVGGEINVVNASGSLTINGEFVGPIRAEKISKGVRFVSQRSDLTLTQLTGHMETGSGNFDIVDAPGNISLRTSANDIDIENPTGRINIVNRDASVRVRFSSPPKDDVEITNSSGEISLDIPASSSFQIQADCHSCDIDSDFSAPTLNKTTKESGDSHLEGKYGSGRAPRIVLKTTYGTITLRKTS